jgi:hypothetical protein
VSNIAGAAGLASLPEFAVRAIGAAGTSYALYASKLDNVTSDPIFITPIPARTRQWVDGIGAIIGAGSTRFVSSLSIANRTTDVGHVHIDFIPRGAGAPSRSADLTLGSGQSRFFASVMSELFATDNAVGTLMITSDAPVQAWARTYSDRGANGTFGQFIPSFGAEDLIGAHGAILQGLSHNDAFRTNAGFFNTSAAPVDIRVIAYSGGGSVLSQTVYTVDAGHELAVNGILVSLGISPQSDIDLKVEVSTAGAVYAWASSVDNASTDQTFVRPIAIH